MTKGLFVTATGTDVGKTFVTALIVKKLRAAGYNAGYYKAALSGVEKTEAGFLAGDAGYVTRSAGMEEDPGKFVSYVYENAVSPHLAAQLEGNPVEMRVVKAAYAQATAEYDYVTMEGSGGIVCPIRYDSGAHILLEDIIKELKLSTILVADAGLGTINAVVLTIAYMKQRNIAVKGIIFNHFHAGNVMEWDNKKMVEALTGVPVIAFVKENDTEISMDADVLAALYE
jgi:dethiobiotin synthetase